MLSSRGPANLHDDPEPAELDELELDGQLGRAMLRHLNGHDSLLCVARELSVRGGTCTGRGWALPRR